MLPLVWDLADEDGRPLTEGVGEERACPYPDARRGWPMNVEALAQVRRHWGFITAQISATSGPRLTEAFQASLKAIYAPFAGPRPVPAPVSALYKACAGFSQVFCFLLLEGEPRPEPLFPWLDAEGWLLGTHQACAGPRAMVEELAACFREGPGGSPGPELTEVALQTALAIATYRAPVRGGLGLRLLEECRAPWMHAVTLKPRRDPALARVFQVLAVEHFLAHEHPAMTPGERDELYRVSLGCL